MKDRLSRFLRLLTEREIDAAIITNEKNIGYLCSYRFDDGCLLIGDGYAYLITDFRYTEEASRLAVKDFTVVTPEDKNAFIDGVLKRANAKSVGYESRSLTVAQYHTYERELSVPLVPIGDILLEMRAVKDEDEISAVKAAQKITDDAFSHLLTFIYPAITEREIALELSYFMQKQGAQGNSFDIIAVSGTSSALPHGKCRNLTISEGFLTIDFGCIYNGYCSDMTRTLSVGKASEDMRRLYQTVLQAQLSAIPFIREGALCKDVDAVARGVIERAGYHGAFGHSLGHGVGLDIHELPNLSPRQTERRLKAGNIVTVEPGIYLEGKYGCRIEDMGVVTEDGFENLTKTPKELIELFV